MIINKQVIKELKPCNDLYENYLKYYKNKEFTPAQFMGLKNITHKDKLWVGFRLIPKDKIRFVAADIAESVLPIFEEKYPGDLRPRNAIEAARSGDANAASAASAAYAAYASAAHAAARAAAYAASDAAYAANAASDAAYAANAAASDAAYAADAGEERKMQEKLIRKILLRYLK
jgi:predicted lipid-binding transport protein (Tim44 family)